MNFFFFLLKKTITNKENILYHLIQPLLDYDARGMSGVTQ